MSITLNEDQRDGILSGKKKATIRWEVTNVSPGPLTIEFRGPNPVVSPSVNVNVTEVLHAKYGDLDNAKAKQYGFTSMDVVEKIQEQWAPHFSRDDVLTVISFELASPSPDSQHVA